MTEKSSFFTCYMTVALFSTIDFLFTRNKKTMKTLNEDIQCSARNSNLVTSESKSESILFKSTRSVQNPIYQ